jgi:hypothetical protein
VATRKKAAPPIDVPSVLLGDEGNPSIARAKTPLAKKWSLTRAETVDEAVQLAWFFVALRRDGEARELVDHIVDRITFSGDASVWSHASNVIALAARLARLRDDQARRASLVARLVEHPAVTREALARALTEPERDVRSAEVESSQKWACQFFARGCARAAYFTETETEGGYPPGAIDVTALESTITEGIAGLRAYLTR